MITSNPGTRIAQCRCGQLTARCTGVPVRISVCHCLACQRRTGSAFSAQARFLRERVLVIGEYKTFVRTADSGSKAVYQFCPVCGSTLAYENEGLEALIAIPLGAFADPDFPPPTHSVYEHRKHAWVAVLGGAVEHEG